MERHLNQGRIAYYSRTTIGALRVEDEFFCYTLEDTCRPFGVKVMGETAIPASPPEGYKVGIRYSPSAGKDRLILYTEGDGVTLMFGGISFQYINTHGGNKHEHSDGCVLVAFNRNEDVIQSTAEQALFDKVAPWILAGDDVRWHIKNNPQTQ